MEENEIKFGNKNYGRTPIERLIIFLEKKGILRQVTNLLLLVVLIGINSHIHDETTKGIQFLVIVFLILYSGNESTTNFFGASTLAIFIIIHLSLYEFNAIALILTFVTFLIFKNKLKRNFLGPISIYLIFDSLFIYFDLQFTSLFYSLSNYIFSSNTIILLSIIPITYLFMTFERQGKNISSNTLLQKYIVFISLFFLFGLFFLIGMITSNSILVNISHFILTFYLIGAFLYQNEIKTLVFLLLPIGVILLIAHIFKLQLHL